MDWVEEATAWKFTLEMNVGNIEGNKVGKISKFFRWTSSEATEGQIDYLKVG